MGRSKFTRILAGFLCGVIISANLSPSFDVYASELPESEEGEMFLEETQGETSADTPEDAQGSTEAAPGDIVAPDNVQDTEERTDSGFADDSLEEMGESTETREISVKEFSNQQEVELDEDGNIASGTEGTITWIIDKNGNLIVEGTGNAGWMNAAWYSYKEYIKTARISVTEVTYSTISFSGYMNLVSVDLSGCDTSRLTNMDSMFSGCRNLVNINLNGLDTSQVTTMS